MTDSPKRPRGRPRKHPLPPPPPESRTLIVRDGRSETERGSVIGTLRNIPGSLTVTEIRERYGVADHLEISSVDDASGEEKVISHARR